MRDKTNLYFGTLEVKMSLFEMMERFPNEAACLEFLEGIRFKEGAYCPLCGSIHVAKKGEKKQTGRWNCHDCHASFKVLRGTMFHGTKIPLQKWFLAIVIMANAKKSLSSCQLARHLAMNQKSTWFMMQRIRAEMAKKDSVLLKGIIEADETYVGGRPRKSNKHGKDDDVPKNKTGGHGDNKTAVVGAVERGGKVKAKVVKAVTGKETLKLLKEMTEPANSVLMTDESKIYFRAAMDFIRHEVIRHTEQYVDGEVHTNTIEGFWSLLKRAWYGQHHHYSKDFLPLYVAEACYKYNNREREDFFDYFVRGCFKK